MTLPLHERNFVSRTLDAMERGQLCTAASDITVSPTYVPDLVHACLDLLIDKEKGIWHLTNGTPVTWLELASMVAQAVGAKEARLEPARLSPRSEQAPRPLYSALGSERARLLPGLSDALGRYAALRADPTR